MNGKLFYEKPKIEIVLFNLDEVRTLDMSLEGDYGDNWFE